MPCWEWFEAQDQAYRDQVLPPAVRARVAVEAAEPRLWRGYVGDAGVVIGIDHFGESASGSVLMREFGFTTDHVVAAARQSMHTVEDVSYTHLDVYKRQVVLGTAVTGSGPHSGDADEPIRFGFDPVATSRLHSGCLLYTSRCV